MSWDAWLDDGRGAFPFGRPIRWLVVLLDGEVVPFADPRARGGRQGAHHRRERRGDARPPLPARRARPRDARSRSARSPSCSRTLRERLRDRLDPGSARRGSRRPAPRRRSRRRVAGPRPARGVARPRRVPDGDGGRGAAGVPRPAARGARDGPRAPPEVHRPPRRGRAHRPLRGRDQRRRRLGSAEIVRGMERVVVARLRDAVVLPRARTASGRSPTGSPTSRGVTFHQGLGTYRDKSERMASARRGDGPAGPARPASALAAATQAAQLAKADLVTLMVREFPELQGVMGGIYLAERGRLRAEVAARRALALPPDRGRAGRGARAAAFAGRDEARARVRGGGARRQARHARRLLRPRREPDRQPRPVRPAARGAGRGPRRARLLAAEARREGRRPRGAGGGRGRGLPAAQAAGRRTTAAAVQAFLLDRLEYVLVGAGLRGGRGGGGAAGARSRRRSPTRGLRWQRAAALQRVRREVPEDFAALAEAFKRAKNILAQAAAGGDRRPDALRGRRRARAPRGRLGPRAGQGLRRGPPARPRLAARPGRALLRRRARHGRGRRACGGNRLALLKQTLSLFYRIADISRLGGTS